MPVQRNLNEYFEDVKKLTETAPTRKSFKTENAFIPTYKDDKFSCVIRFLPSHPDEFKPFVENRSHMIKLGENNWFGCDCLTKFGKPCPICDFNRKQYKIYKNKDEARQHTLSPFRVRYISNILVVRNPANKETEGKVYRFEYGKQIMKMITEAMTDHDDGLEMRKGFNPFDWYKGANFVYEGVKSSNGPKLDGSHFGPIQAINRWDGEKYVDMTTAEIDDVESRLYHLDECYRKEEDCPDYNAILERWARKTGKTLFDEMPVSDTLTVSSIAATNPFAGDIVKPKTEAPKIEPIVQTTAPQPVKVSEPETLDDDSFWKSIGS